MALTNKQQTALARARNPAARAKLSKFFSSQKRNGNGNRNGGGMQRVAAPSVLAPGVGSSVPRPFGSLTSASPHCWDAKMPHHLPLPRAVGPYTVIRATKRFSTSAGSVLLGTFKESKGGPTGAPDRAGEWSTTCALEDVAIGSAINAASNAVEINVPLSTLGPAATLCPSAFSVQVMNPNALQTTSGIIYMGCMHTQANIAGRTETWESYFDKFVNYQSPRLIAAPRLALRGVQINSYPLNMTDVSEFTPLSSRSDGTVTADAQFGEPTGWAPILVYNPDFVNLEYLVTVEYRVRFDLNNPAAASHIHHPVASDSLWNKMIAGASSLGHGVLDIAEKVANVGQVAGSLYDRTRALQGFRQLPMLVD